jgi:multicomponent Na+:H+ antiporter subunit D
MFMLAGMNGLVLTGDLFSLYVFLEIASISAYILVAFSGKAESIEAAFKYAIMGSVASIFILLGIGLLYSYTSSLNMAEIASVLTNVPQGTLIGFVSILFLAGFGLKAAIVPFHAWLPDAHSSAPSPVSAVLSGVFIKVLGVYALSRVFFNVLGFSAKIPMIFMVLGVISMFIGAILAFAQNDIKRMFAYSSISQVGYIIFALGIGTPLAILGALFHLFNHALFKPLLFFNAGSIEYSSGIRDLNSMGGLNKKLPLVGWTSLFGALSISGVPPFGGFWSKLIIVIAALNAGHTGFAFLAVLAGVLTLIYYVKFQTLAFFGKENNAFQARGIPLAMKWPVIFLAICTLLSGFLLVGHLRVYLDSAVKVLSSGASYNEILTGVLNQ